MVAGRVVAQLPVHRERIVVELVAVRVEPDHARQANQGHNIARRGRLRARWLLFTPRGGSRSRSIVFDRGRRVDRHRTRSRAAPLYGAGQFVLTAFGLLWARLVPAPRRAADRAGRRSGGRSRRDAAPIMRSSACDELTIPPRIAAIETTTAEIWKNPCAPTRSSSRKSPNKRAGDHAHRLDRPDRRAERAGLQRALRDDHSADRRDRERVRLPVRHPREEAVAEVVHQRLGEQRGHAERDARPRRRGTRRAAGRVVARPSAMQTAIAPTATRAGDQPLARPRAICVPPVGDTSYRNSASPPESTPAAIQSERCTGPVDERATR